MRSVLLLAWRYIVYHRVKTLLLLCSLALVGYLPLTVSRLITEYERGLMARAEGTPLIVGGKGSRFDLALHALYFRAKVPDEITADAADRIAASGLAQSIPLVVKFSAQGFPVVGTSVDYFAFRHLQQASGQGLVRLGDCVLGADVAEALQLSVGDRLMSDPENVFDLAGSYPLNMRVTGILVRTGSPDDQVVFVDTKTSWLIQGLFHGHQELGVQTSSDVILKREEGEVVVNAALMQYNEVTDKNLDSFHFHGDRTHYPLTAVIAIPPDKKSETLLLGRYQAETATEQAIRPLQVVEELMGMVFRIKRFFDMNMALMLVSAGLFMTLVVMLSVRLRHREMQMMFKLGCSRATMFKLQAAEIMIILCTSAAIAAAGAQVSLWLVPALMQQFIS